MMRTLGRILCILFLFSATALPAQHLDLRKYDRLFPRRWSHNTIVDLADEFRIMDTLVGKGFFNWQGTLIKPISGKQDYEKKWYALFQTPIGNKAIIYVARWDDETWVRGVWAQVWGIADGRLLWEGNLTDVDGGDGGTVDHFACIHDLNRDGYSDITFHEYTWYYTYDTLEEGAIFEQERYWTLLWNGNGFDSVELKVNDRVRFQFYDGFRNNAAGLFWVIPSGQMDSITLTHVDNQPHLARSYLFVPFRNQGRLYRHQDWVTHEIISSMGRAPLHVKYKKRIRRVYTSLRTGECETRSMLFRLRHRKKSIIFIDERDCKPAIPLRDPSYLQKDEYECECFTPPPQ